MGELSEFPSKYKIFLRTYGWRTTLQDCREQIRRRYSVAMKYANPDSLVSPNWLAECLEEPGLRVVEIRPGPSGRLEPMSVKRCRVRRASSRAPARRFAPHGPSGIAPPLPST
jgi:hypothetical protein